MMLIDTERFGCKEARNVLAAHPITAAVPHVWVLSELAMPEKVKSVRADFESYSVQ